MPNSSISYDIIEPTKEQYIEQLIDFFDKRYGKCVNPKYIIQEVTPDNNSPTFMKSIEYEVSNLRFYTELDGELICSKYSGDFVDIRIINMIHKDNLMSIGFSPSENRVTVSMDCAYINIWY